MAPTGSETLKFPINVLCSYLDIKRCKNMILLGLIEKYFYVALKEFWDAFFDTVLEIMI